MALPATAGGFQRWEHHTLDMRGLWPDVGDIGCASLVELNFLLKHAKPTSVFQFANMLQCINDCVQY
jgi:hypothetical protein